MTESWILTLPCTRAEAEAVQDAEIENAVLTVCEPDPDQPDR